MEIKINPNSFFIFDLDDTLYQEIDFLKSAYRSISRKLEPFLKKEIYEEMFTQYQRKENVFQWILDTYKNVLPKVDIQWFLTEYREHLPDIKLSKETQEFIQKVRDYSIPMGLITDGRSITQRNKLKALGIESYFSDIIISEEFGSEKPDERNYLYFTQKYPGKVFYFFGDNTSKDFIIPLKLGWNTICIKCSGKHIHKQDFNTVQGLKFIITSFNDLKL